MDRAIIARYRGRCPLCKKSIVAGEDLIVETEPGTWAHDSCAEDAGYFDPDAVDEQTSGVVPE